MRKFFRNCILFLILLFILPNTTHAYSDDATIDTLITLPEQKELLQSDSEMGVSYHGFKIEAVRLIPGSFLHSDCQESKC